MKIRVAVFLSKDWKNYPDFMRYITVFIQDSHESGHDGIIFVHSGKRGPEDMISEYVGKTEKMLRQNNFKLKEDIIYGGSNTNVKIIESNIDYALVFSTGCKKTKSCIQILDAYNIPFRVYEHD